MNFVRRKEYAAVTALVMFLALYALVSGRDAASVIAVEDNMYPQPSVYPQPVAYPQPAYPQPVAYPQPAYPQPAYPCVVRVIQRRLPPRVTLYRPRYIPRQPARNLLRFIFSPRVRIRGSC